MPKRTAGSLDGSRWKQLSLVWEAGSHIPLLCHSLNGQIASVLWSSVLLAAGRESSKGILEEWVLEKHVVKTGISSWPASLPGPKEFFKYRKYQLERTATLGVQKRALFTEPNTKGSEEIHSWRATAACRSIWTNNGTTAAGCKEASDYEDHFSIANHVLATEAT